MTDIFENVANKYKNSPSALILFLASITMLVIGANHFAEDTYSSYLGLKSLEAHFNMKVQIFDWTYWTMSLAPQIASIVFFYIYLANTDKKWALSISVGAQIADFMSDLWYRSNGAMFTKWDVTFASAAITFVFFTVGSEFFLSFGAGLCIKLAAPALYSWKYYRHEVKRIVAMFEKASHNPQPRSEYRIPESQEKPREKPTFREEHLNKLPKSNNNSENSQSFENLHRVNSEHRESPSRFNGQ